MEKRIETPSAKEVAFLSDVFLTFAGILSMTVSKNFFCDAGVLRSLVVRKGPQKYKQTKKYVGHFSILYFTCYMFF